LGRAAIRDAATRLVTVGVRGCFASPQAVSRVARRITDTRRAAIIGASPGRLGSDDSTSLKLVQTCRSRARRSLRIHRDEVEAPTPWWGADPTDSVRTDQRLELRVVAEPVEPPRRVLRDVRPFLRVQSEVL